jgi:SAM-dependent methyltransferase
MPIYWAADYIDEYRLRARSSDIHQLTGRLRPELTEFIIDQILLKTKFKSDSVVVDIGCGNALFLQKAAANGVDRFRGRLIGIVPTEEETRCLREYLSGTEKDFISIETGNLCATNLADEFADIVISNGTFMLLRNDEAAIAAISEIKRITKTRGTVFIGELPDADEALVRTYGDSITAWLLWQFTNRGSKALVAGLKQILRALLTAEPFIVSTPKKFFCSPQKFKMLLETQDFKILECYKHKEIDTEQNIFESQTSWNFIACKESA